MLSILTHRLWTGQDYFLSVADHYPATDGLYMTTIIKSVNQRRVGIDIGGTFTDMFLIEPDGTSRIYKSPTTPKDPSEGLINVLTKAADDLGEELVDFLSQVETIVHGTTIATNAVLTRKGAKTGFVTTSGLKYLLNRRLGSRKRLNDSQYAPPEPLVPRELIATVDQRTDVNGEVVVPLDEGQLRAAAELFRNQQVEAVAISYLWSFLDPAHEDR